jgi:uncharacterized membrane protein HdeD (DUF308 family)
MPIWVQWLLAIQCVVLGGAFVSIYFHEAREKRDWCWPFGPPLAVLCGLVTLVAISALFHLVRGAK